MDPIVVVDQAGSLFKIARWDSYQPLVCEGGPRPDQDWIFYWNQYCRWAPLRPFERPIDEWMLWDGKGKLVRRLNQFEAALYESIAEIHR